MGNDYSKFPKFSKSITQEEKKKEQYITDDNNGIDKIFELLSSSGVGNEIYHNFFEKNLPPFLKEFVKNIINKEKHHFGAIKKKKITKKRKSNKLRKSNRRKSNRKKSNRKKSNRRKSNKLRKSNHKKSNRKKSNN